MRLFSKETLRRHVTVCDPSYSESAHCTTTCVRHTDEPTKALLNACPFLPECTRSCRPVGMWCAYCQHRRLFPDQYTCFAPVCVPERPVCVQMVPTIISNDALVDDSRCPILPR